jgi:hypothetical protein
MATRRSEATTTKAIGVTRWGRRRHRPEAMVWPLWIGLMLAGCAPSARTEGPYSAKAVKAAQAAHSAVASDLLVLQALERNHTLAPFVSVATSDAEDNASSAASSFLSIQPPDPSSEALRNELSTLMSQAQDALGQARIAGRRGNRAALLATRAELERVAGQLDDFGQAHQ